MSRGGFLCDEFKQFMLFLREQYFYFRSQILGNIRKPSELIKGTTYGNFAFNLLYFSISALAVVGVCGNNPPQAFLGQTFLLVIQNCLVNGKRSFHINTCCSAVLEDGNIRGTHSNRKHFF